MKIEKKRFNRYRTVAVFAMLLLLPACSQMEVKDATITIKPYYENDRGKFWEICIDHDVLGFSDDPIAFFEIHAKDNQIKEYSVDFIHLEEKCNDKNLLVSFTDRSTSQEEQEWLKALDAH